MARQVTTGGNLEGLPISEAVQVGDLLFVSGMVGFVPDGNVVQGGIAAETAQMFADLERALGRAGMTMQHLVKVNVYLADTTDFEAFNAVYAMSVGPVPPARICVVTALTIEARVEMDFIAHRDI